MSSLDPIKWTLEFDLANGGSGLKTAASLLGDVQKLTKGLFDSFNSLTRSLGSFSSALGGITVSVQGLKTAFAALDEFTDRAVEAFSERTSALRTYTTVLGDAKAAQEEFNFVSQLAQKTEFDRAQIERVSRKLVTSNFKDESERRAAELTIADIASAAPLNERETALNRATLGFTKIQGRGKIQLGDLRQFLGLLSTKDITEEIAKSLGIKSDQVFEKGRKVSSDVGIAAIQRATLKQFGTSKLGEFATGAAGDITTMLSNQKEAEKNALLNIAPETLASYETYRESIQGITDAMNQQTNEGKNYKYILETISEIGMAVRTFINDFKSGFLDSFGQVFGAVRELLGENGFGDVQEGLKGLSALFKGLGFVIGLVAGVISGTLIKAWDYLIVLARQMSIGFRFLYASLKDAGDYISDKTLDIYDGLKSIFEGLYTLIKGVINLSFDTIKEGWNKLSNSSFSSRSGGKSYEEARNSLSQELAQERTEALKKATEALKNKNKATGTGDLDKGGAGGGGRGRGRGRGESGLAVDFNAYGGPLADLAAYMQMKGVSNPSLPGATYVPQAINGSPNLPSLKPQIHIEKFEQYIDGGGTSPKEIADEAYTRFTQEIGRRIVRSPSPLVT